MRKQKTYEELTFTDDFMFCKILEQNQELCEEIVELVLNTKIEIVKPVERQKAIEITPDGKGIRFDIRLEGDTTIYGLEMQNAHKKELPKRSRYYLSLTNLDLMERGAQYSEMKDSVLIFFCTFDPFELGRRTYTIKKKIDEEPGYDYNDGEKLIFISSLPNQTGNESDELKEFLSYVNGDPSNSKLAARLDEAIQKAKSQKTWRKEYMLLSEYIDDARQEGREEERKLAEQEKRESAKKLKEAGVAPEIIAESMGLSTDEF